MLNHGDKLDEHLYFCMYPITLKTYAELEKLAKAAYAYLPIFRDFSYMAQACGYTKEEAAKQLNEKGLNHTKKYEGSGASALLEVFATFQMNVEGYYTDESSCFLACFSSKKLNSHFLFERDAAYIEMMMSVLTHKQLDYVIHLGIQRSICYALKGHPTHNNISMLLHGCAAAYVMQHSPEKKFMVTNPLRFMKDIFYHNIATNNIHCIASLVELRAKLGIEPHDGSAYVQTFRIEALQEAMHTAISLDVLSGFSRSAIPESSISAAVPQACSAYIDWMVEHPKFMAGGMGFLISLSIVASHYPNEVYENVAVVADLVRAIYTAGAHSFFSTSNYPENQEDRYSINLR